MTRGPSIGTDLGSSARGTKSNETSNASRPAQVPKGKSRSKTEVNQLVRNNDSALSHKDLFKLGKSHLNQFWRDGELNELDKAIEYGNRALDLTPDGHPDLWNRHAELGLAYGIRVHRLGDMKDLEKAMNHYSRALDLTADGDPNLPRRHAELGVACGLRFQHLGDLDDLQNAIKHQALALDLTPEGHSDLSRRHVELGVSYNLLFQRLGDLNDLERAIDQYARALDLTPEDHPDLAHRHAQLGVSYHDRFQRLGQMGDLEKAIEHKARAVGLTPTGHRDLLHWHDSLGVSYNVRFQRLGDTNDLDKAIEHHARALDLTPDRHPSLPAQHAHLTLSYHARFKRLDDLNDLKEAIEHGIRALDLTPVGHPDSSDRHGSLGVSYHDRFRRLGDITDLEIALEHKSRALTLTPNGHPSLPWKHFNLALSHIFRYDSTNDPSHLNDALESFRKASQVQAGSPRDRFRYALAWAHHIFRYPQVNGLEAYQTAIDLLPQFTWLGVTTDQRYEDLSLTESLATNSTSVAILHSGPRLALEWLEHTRCIVWNQSIMLRSPLDQLHSSYPDLAIRLQTVSKDLHDISSGSANSEQVGKQRRRLANEYNDLLAEARALPGFGDLLQPMKSDGFARAARNGPIVVINCHRERSDALIIIPGRKNINHFPLPSFTEEKAQNARSELEASLKHRGLRERGVKFRKQPAFKDRIPNVLLSLWYNIVKPVLDFLEYSNDVPIDNLPHITWCPTGALSFLPLHAAGDYDKPRSRTFDYAISSYTPTLTALLVSTPSTLTPGSRVLGIGQAMTPGHAPLPGINRELAYLQAHIQNHVEYSQLIDDQATTVSVLEAMEQHEWVHFACHAHQNIIDPTKSGLYLHDGTLDLASINRRSFKNKGLAFLSACQTATGDEKLPDEAIHLASGMLMAGYPSVIATMWSVVDGDAPLVANKVYAELMKKGSVGNGEAGKALHLAVAKLRDEVGENEFVRWAPYIHIGS